LTPKDELLSNEEIIRLCKLFASEGVTKLRLTGGEPTVRKDLVDLIASVRREAPQIETIGLTTNGLTLWRKAEALKEAGLTSVNISLDTLDENLFTVMTRRLGHDRVLRSIDRSVDVGFAPVKINCVVMRGVNDMEVPQFVDQMTRERPVDVRFIEYMPFDGNQWADTKMVPFHEMVDGIERHVGAALERLDGEPNDTAKSFRVPGYTGTVSFISSMTDHFCATCNRLRITADGNLKVCLFGPTEVSLRDLMRQGSSDQELLPVISAAIDRKKASHAGMYNLAKTNNRPMILIGG
jgi:molybdenum cofactor biosynthesis protein A